MKVIDAFSTDQSNESLGEFFDLMSKFSNFLRFRNTGHDMGGETL
jgi:hypothetical protein